MEASQTGRIGKLAAIIVQRGLRLVFIIRFQNIISLFVHAQPTGIQLERVSVSNNSHPTSGRRTATIVLIYIP